MCNGKRGNQKTTYVDKTNFFAVAFVLLSPNPFPKPNLEPFRIAMVRDAPYTKDDAPMDNILAILAPGLLKETTEERFNMILAQLKVLGWKSKKSARYDWVSLYCF